MTVIAIGLNILPSIPARLRIGTYTTVMINTPKNIGLATSFAALNTVSIRSRALKIPPVIRWRSPRRRTIFSTITTAPSMISPKSMAPRLIRFPVMRQATMPDMANRKESGMASETINAARILPSNSNRMKATRTAP